MAKGTFNYHDHNVCGGPSHRHVHQGPLTRICVGDKWVNLRPAPAKLPKPVPAEGHYVTRENGGTMSPTDFKMLVLAARKAKTIPKVESESTEDWLRRHKIGEYAEKSIPMRP